MDVPQTLPQQITQALEHGWTVLTANQRASRTLHRAFDLRQRSLGHTCWEPPAVLPWSAWLEVQWHRLLLEGHASELLLNATQERTVWRAIVAADAATASLRPLDSLAQTAAEAWALLHDYRAARRLNSLPGNADTTAFARWAAEFERHCAHSRYLTQAQLQEALRAAFSAGNLTPPNGILLVGFDSKTPAQVALLNAIEATATPIEDLALESPGAPSIAALPQWVGRTTPDPRDLSTTPPHRCLVSAPDDHAELTACARWLRTLLSGQPHARVAVIVPAMDTGRAEIDRVFRHILTPELNDIAATTSSGPFEFSLGVPLAQTPMAATALDILRWATGALPLDRVCALLLSPRFAAGTSPSEYLARAEFDAFVLRRQHLLRPAVSLDALYTFISQSKHATRLPALLSRLRALHPLFNASDLTKSERTHAAWAATIHDLLEAAGWALLSQLDSIEFQTRRKWESALDELATLDFDGASVSFANALASLERIASETLFAPESRHAPIQIMGPLESAGSAFDALWFLRASDLAWPSTPAPNPLLPWPLQRELAMPGADPAHDTAHARRIAERIAASAPAVIFSYAKQSAEDRQRPSPLLAELGLTVRDASEISPAENAPPQIELDAFADDAQVPPPPDRVLQGGAGILQSQAQCGFRAFAEKRLYSSTLDPASLGLDAGERGSIVHEVLQHFWEAVETQAALSNMPVAERDAQLSRSIDAAFRKDLSRIDPGWPRAYINAERQRLLNLLKPWLDFEANVRSPFAVKSREEKQSDVKIGPLHIEVRIDRVDIDMSGEEPGGEIILDYKTGSANPSDWLGERPDAPQLPLYAVVSKSPNLAAVAFASVRLGKDMGMRGYQAHDRILPKAAELKTESLAAQVDQWREVLTSLAYDFHSGEARVSPKRYPHTCEHCEQRLLCRLDPSTLETDALNPEVLDPEVLDPNAPEDSADSEDSEDPAEPDPFDSADPEADRD